MAVAITLGVVFLFIFYRAIQSQWPEAYFGASDVSAYAISATPTRYALFHLLPVFVVCLAVAVLADRRGLPGSLAGISIGVIHGCLSLGRSLIVWGRSDVGQRSHRASIALMRGFVFLGVVGAAFAAVWTRRILEPVVPSLTELNTALWTALLSGVAAATVLRFSAGNALSASDLALRSFRSLPQKLVQLGLHLAEQAEADRTLICALMTVENIERPGWFRFLERLKARVIPSGTYGVLQVLSKSPVSDEASIREVAERFARVRVTDDKGRVDRDALKRVAANYNSSANFLPLLESAYAVVQQSLPPSAQAS
jgi:hypothetical protein